MEEPRLVDDPFDDRDMSIEGQGFWDVELCKKAFNACGRTRGQFKNDQEITRWRRIDEAVDDLKIPVEWIYDRCGYAEKYHWSLSQLMSSILNVGKMEEWLARNKRSLGGTTIRQEVKSDAIRQTRHD